MKIGQYFTKLRRTKQSVPVFWATLYVRHVRHAGEFERWKLTVTAAEILRSVTYALLFPHIYVLLSCLSLFR